MKFILRGARLSDNEGAAAMSYATIDLIRELYPDSLISLTTPCFEEDKKRAKAIKNLNVFRNIGGKELLVNMFKSFLGMKTPYSILMQEYKKSNIILDITGDTYSDDYGFKMSFFDHFNLFLAMKKCKNTIIMPQSIGEYHYFITTKLAKYCFNNCKQVIAREEITFKILKDLKIKTLCPKIILDMGFHMNPSFKGFKEVQKKIDKSSNLIGISLSNAISKFSTKNKSNPDLENAYINKMVSIINNYTAKGHDFVFIPHVWTDLHMCKKLYAKVKNQEKIILFEDRFTAPQLKGIISQCEMFIGARMHANIAALSTHVPVVAISYSHKTQGIMGMCGQGKYVVDVKKLSEQELIDKIEDCWKNRAKIKKELKVKVSKHKKEGKEHLTKIIKDVVKK